MKTRSKVNGNKDNHAGDGNGGKNSNNNNNHMKSDELNDDNKDSNDDGDCCMKPPYCLVLKQARVFCVKKLSHSWNSTLCNVHHITIL